MQLYPHWLDGEFVRIASSAASPSQTFRSAVRALKLHALLGTQFVLNDVQIFDSAAILGLFADRGFRDFVYADRSFLDLRVEPDPRLGTSPYALAARGFARTRASGWISSVFMEDPTPIKRLADEIIENVQVDTWVNPEKPSPVAQAYPQFRKALNAARYAVHYFGSCDRPEELKARPGERTSYYKVLCDLVEKRLEPEDRMGVEAAIEFIDHEIQDPGAKHARSRVLAVLDRADPLQREQIWNYVVQAWNYATQQTLRPEGGSVGTLPGAVSPAQYLDSPRDILVPMKAVKRLDSMVEDPPHLPCDLDRITWAEVGRVRAATKSTIQKLDHARWEGDRAEVIHSLREHLKAAVQVLLSPENPSKIDYLLMMGDEVVAVIGNPLRLPFRVARLRHEIRPKSWRQRRALTSTLFRAALGEPE